MCPMCESHDCAPVAYIGGWTFWGCDECGHTWRESCLAS